jgi:hypothetical protein
LKLPLRIFLSSSFAFGRRRLGELRQVFVDGTKIEDQAGRYTFVWANAIKTNKEKMLRQLEELWKYAQNIAREEDKDPEPPEFKQGMLFLDREAIRIISTTEENFRRRECMITKRGSICRILEDGEYMTH